MKERENIKEYGEAGKREEQGVVGAEGREKLRSWREAGKNSSSSEGKILRGARLLLNIVRIHFLQ